MIPTGPQTTLEHFDFYFTEPEPNEQEMAGIRHVDDVLQVKDFGLTEIVQRGLDLRGYDQGRFIVDGARSEVSDHAVRHYHGLVLDVLTG